MDGKKIGMTASLQRRLSLGLMLAILSVALIAGAFSFFSAFAEAHEFQDDVLRQVATLFDRHHLTTSMEGDAGKDADNNAESRVFVQLLSPKPISSADQSPKPLLPLPSDLVDGMHTLRAGNDTYRVLVRTLGTGQRLAVAQETAVRDELARDSALRTLMPFLILFPILLLVVADLVRKIFRPVSNLASELDQRSEQELHPVATESLPTEIRPFIDAINRLLGRVGRLVDAERRFVADAAHELRTPLAAMSLQAERLAEAEMSSKATERLNTLRQGIARGRSLLDQLLALARAQVVITEPDDAVSVQRVYRRVLEDLMPLADANDIDIGITTDLDANVPIREIDLIAMVKNLVDNAIRYTPSGGRVDLSILTTSGFITLVVEDTGPGIPKTEHRRVFDPFYRVLGSNEIGSGLGLSIVKTIADRIGATVSLGPGDGQSTEGLRVAVSIPLPMGCSDLEQ